MKMFVGFFLAVGFGILNGICSGYLPAGKGRFAESPRSFIAVGFQLLSRRSS
jgi:hypothetical protein